MKKQYFINANIIDPHNSLNENGGLIIDEFGTIEAIGKKVNNNNNLFIYLVQSFTIWYKDCT